MKDKNYQFLKVKTLVSCDDQLRDKSKEEIKKVACKLLKRGVSPVTICEELVNRAMFVLLATAIYENYSKEQIESVKESLWNALDSASADMEENIRQSITKEIAKERASKRVFKNREDEDSIYNKD